MRVGKTRVGKALASPLTGAASVGPTVGLIAGFRLPRTDYRLIRSRTVMPDGIIGSTCSW